MNEETTLPTEVLAAPEPTTAAESTIQETTEILDWSVMATEETTAEVVISLEDLHSVESNLAHVDLFGSFLICGTLVGLALLRNRHAD